MNIFYMESLKFGTMASIMGRGTSHSFAMRGQQEDTSVMRSKRNLRLFCERCLSEVLS